MVPVPEEDDNLSAEDLLKKLNLPSASASSSSKPKIVEVTNAKVKPPQVIKPVVKPVKQGETSISMDESFTPSKPKETVVKSIAEYNAEQERKALKKDTKVEPKVTLDFNIEHKKGNMLLKFDLPNEESAANIDIQLNESSFILESPNYF